MDGTGAHDPVQQPDAERAGDRPSDEQDLLDKLDVRPGIRVGNLDGTGTASTLFGGESASLFAAMLKAPVGTGNPEISGGAKTGKDLTCQNGSWAPDLVGAFLYRAPTSFTYQWKRNGGRYIATRSRRSRPPWPGDYTCTVTATNQAGSTSQMSPVKKVKDK